VASNENGVTEIKGDRKGVGYRRYPKETNFTDVTLRYGASDSFYMTTDGLIDQIGARAGGPSARAASRSC
jgi:hypothetical protein